MLPFLESATGVLASAVTIVGGLLAAAVWVRAYSKKIFSRLDLIPKLDAGQAALATRVDEFQKDLTSIKGELKLNGGDSLKDMVARQEARRLAFFDATEAPVFEATKSGHLYWANRALLRLLGCQLSDLEGTGWLRFVAPECSHAIEEWKIALSERRAFRDQLVLIAEFGDRVKVMADGAPMKLLRGNDPIGYLVYLRPATDTSILCPATGDSCPAMRKIA